MNADQERALKIARSLAEAGVPLFLAPPDDSAVGYRLPKSWQLTEPDPNVVDSWVPGMALCAVMGVVVDGLDIDPRHGGDEAEAGLLNAGAFPTSYGRQATPSGGTHDLIAPLGVGSPTAVRPGLDLRGGSSDGRGRGFLFLAPTERVSKTTGELASYEWEVEPDLSELLDGTVDDSGLTLAGMVGRSEPSAAVVIHDPADAKHTGPIAEGQRHDALVSYAGYLRGEGVPFHLAERLMLVRLADCSQPPHARHPVTEAEALAKLRDCYDRYAEGASRLPAVGESDDPELAREVELLLRKARARQIVAEMEAVANPLPEVDHGTLAEILDRPDEGGAFRIEGVLPAEGRMTIVAQRKTGKTTLLGNLARSLVTGDPFLDRFEVHPITGRVVVLNYEVSDRQFATWMHEAGVPSDRMVIVNLRGRRNLLDSEAGRAELVDIIRAAEGEVLMTDTFSQAFTGTEESSNSEVSAFLKLLDRVAGDAGVREVVLTVHAGWSNERSRGASKLEDWPDSIVTLTRDEDGGRFLRAEGRDVLVEEDALRFDPDGRRLSLTGSGSRRHMQGEGRVTRLAEVVAEVVAEHPGANVTRIGHLLRSRGLSLQKGDESKACRAAEDAGLVHHTKGERNSKEFFPGSALALNPKEPDL